VMWVCNQCRKQQEILTKSGDWFLGRGEKPAGLGGALSDPSMCAEADRDKKVRSRSQIPLGSTPSTQDTTQNAPADRSKGPDPSQTDAPVLRSRSEPRDRKRPLSVPEQNGKLRLQGERQQGSGKLRSQASEEREPGERRDSRRLVKVRSQEYPDTREGTGQGQGQGEGRAEPGRRREGEGVEEERRRKEERYRSDPNLARYPGKPPPHDVQGSSGPGEPRDQPENRQTRRGVEGGERRGAPLENHRSYSVDRTVGGGGVQGAPPSKPNHGPQPPGPRAGPAAPMEPTPPDLREPPDWGRKPQSHLDPSSAALMRKAKREKMESMLRNDSLSSDQSESLRPPPPRPYKSKRGINKRQMSVSSSEEEGGSTPEYTSCEDVEIESVSEKGDWECYPLDPTVWHHPVTWQPSKEGDHLIGRITLSKRTVMPKEAGALLGLKVVGGKITETGRLGAFITKVKKGSLADVVGHLRAGDEVLQWNGKSLPGATKKEVYNIILESKTEPQVEIVVSRPIGDIPRIPETSHPPLESSSSSFESQKMERPAISVLSPTSPGTLRDAPQLLPGQLSVKLWYDKVGHQLIVNVLQATDLPARLDGRPRNPYVKMYFLPDRSDKSKRRTKTVKKSSEPKWNQTFLYSHVHRRDFRERMLEITVWDQPRVQEEESDFLGEILIELETALLDDKPHWYKLQTHDLGSLPLPHPSPYLPRRHVHTDSPNKKLQSKCTCRTPVWSQRITDYDDGIGVVSTGGWEPDSTRSRPPSVPLQRSLDEIHHERRSRSPTRYRGHKEPEYTEDRYRHCTSGGCISGLNFIFFCSCILQQLTCVSIFFSFCPGFVLVESFTCHPSSWSHSEFIMIHKAIRGRSAECLHTK
ncbi:hypothetical protein JZ751_027320, partial [Albula glossodonta]